MKLANKLFQELQLLKLPELRRNYQLAGHQIQIGYYNQELLNSLSPALSHLESTEEKSNLTLIVLDSSSNDFKPYIQNLNSKHNNRAQPIYYFKEQQNKITLHFKNELKEFYYINTEKKFAVVWFENANQISISSLATPFRIIFNWYFSEFEFCLLHGAAISSENQSVLILGANGSGKSSSCLACLDMGFKFIADDSVLVNLKDLMAYPLYCSAKILPEDLSYIDQTKFKILMQSKEGKKKYHIFINLNDLSKPTKLKSIIFPEIVQSGVLELKEITAIDAVKLSALSCIAHLPGDSQIVLSSLVNLFKRIKSYKLTVKNREEVVKAIKCICSAQ